MRIDFISDINCPWCALALVQLQQALMLMGEDFRYELYFQPFELNPQLPPKGENLVKYLSDKYGMSATQIEASQLNLKQRGEQVGFLFGKRETIWNSFDAHRLLYWAELELGLEVQRNLKLALLTAYHGQAKNPSDRSVLINIVDELGLDGSRAELILTTDLFEKEVRQRERHWQAAGINAVPSMVINNKHLLQGAQPVEALLNALKQLSQGS